MPNLGAALTELDSKLQLLFWSGRLYLPIIFFISDWNTTENYQIALEEIRKNPFFSKATKIGIVLGDNPDMKMISEVVGNDEFVVKVTDADAIVHLYFMIRYMCHSDIINVFENVILESDCIAPENKRVIVGLESDKKEEWYLPPDITDPGDGISFDPEDWIGDWDVEPWELDWS